MSENYSDGVCLIHVASTFNAQARASRAQKGKQRAASVCLYVIVIFIVIRDTHILF